MHNNNLIAVSIFIEFETSYMDILTHLLLYPAIGHPLTQLWVSLNSGIYVNQHMCEN